jgi:selenophosphate synthase
MPARALPSIIHFCWTHPAAEPAARLRVLPGTRAETQLSHECPKKTHKTGTKAGYVGQSTRTTPRPTATPYDESVPAEIRTILFDPQTAGGLLRSVARADAAALHDALKSASVPAVEIGEVLPPGKPLIQVV